jgi:hypothetical protein
MEENEMAARIETTSQPEAPRVLLKPREAAKILRRSPGTIAIWRCEGNVDLPFLKVNGAILYDLRDLNEFLDRSRRVRGEAPPVPCKRGRPRKRTSTAAA